MPSQKVSQFFLNQEFQTHAQPRESHVTEICGCTRQLQKQSTQAYPIPSLLHPPLLIVAGVSGAGVGRDRALKAASPDSATLQWVPGIPAGKGPGKVVQGEAKPQEGGRAQASGGRWPGGCVEPWVVSSKLQTLREWQTKAKPDGKQLHLECINNKEKREPLHRWWECNLVEPLWRTVRRFLKKLELDLQYNPGFPLLGIHTEETRIERDTCTPMFIAALFTIARTWKQPNVHRQMNG